MQSIVEKEWTEFLRMNEQLMRQEGITDINDLIQDSLQDDETEVHLIQEQQELEEAIASYEQSKLCVNCKKSMLTYTNQLASCQGCGFYATETCLAQIETASYSHTLSCHGSIEYTLEQGTDNSLIAVCNVCDLWDMFYM